MTDVLLFGRILKCDKCNRGSFIFRNCAYKCYGFESEWADCDNVVREPKRRPAFIPILLREGHTFLQRNFGIRTRLIELSPANGDKVQVSARCSHSRISYHCILYTVIPNIFFSSFQDHSCIENQITAKMGVRTSSRWPKKHIVKGSYLLVFLFVLPKDFFLSRLLQMVKSSTRILDLLARHTCTASIVLCTL